MRIKSIFVCVIFSLCLFLLTADEPSFEYADPTNITEPVLINETSFEKENLADTSTEYITEPAINPEAINTETTFYKIQNIFYNTQKAFYEPALVKKIPIDTNTLFKEDELHEYISYLEKKFMDTRLIDSVDITYANTTGTTDEGIATPTLPSLARKAPRETLTTLITLARRDANVTHIDLYITLQKSWNFIIVPYPKYDSTSGFSIKAKLQHYNAFKRMEPFSFDLSYIRTPQKTSIIENEMECVFPFYIGNTNNKIYSDILLSYDIDTQYFKSNSLAGLEFSFPLNNISLAFFLEEQYLVNQDFDAGSDADTTIDGSGIKSRLNNVLGFYIPLSLTTQAFGAPATYTLKPGVMFMYSIHFENPPNTFHLVPTFDIESKNISYVGNFRKGYEVQIETELDFCINNKSLNPNVLAQAMFYYPHLIKKSESFFAPSARIVYYYNLGKQIPMGVFIRGVLDNELKTYHAVVINNDFTFKIFNTRFNGKHTSKFNFEFQTGVFFDTSVAFIPEYVFDQTAGVQVIVQPEKMKSVQGRISVAGNIDFGNPKPDRKGGLEIYLGIGYFY